MAVPPLINRFALVSPTRILDAAQSGSERPAWSTSLGDIARQVPAWDWKTVVSVSRRLYANMGIPRGAINQKAAFAVGRAWDPKFEGDPGAAEWGKLATEWLRDEWFGVCNVRGSMYDFKTDLLLSSISVDRDGDFGILLTEGTSGYPLLQHIPAHRIGCRYNGSWAQVIGPSEAKSFVDDGAGARKEVRGLFAGQRIDNGVIYSPIGRPIGFRILGDLPEDDVDVSERDFIHVFDPEWADQGRGFPAFAHACNDFRDMLQSQQWEQLAQLIASHLGIQVTNETGGADPNDPVSILGGATAGSATLTQETLKGGTNFYWKAGAGSKIESFAPDRPSEMWSSFWDRLTRSALAGINWPYSLAWQPVDANSASQRSELLKAQSTVDDRQDLLRTPARRCVGYAISKAIALGILPPYPGKDKGGFLKWGFTMPPKLSIDRKIEGQNRRENYKLGTQTLSEILAEDGTTLAAHRNQREAEVIDLIDRAQGIATTKSIPFDTALALMEQRSANPILTDTEPQAPQPPIEP